MENKIIVLWLDDIRNPHISHPETGKTWAETIIPKNVHYTHLIWVKSYDQFIQWIETNKRLPDIICFDHDLGLEYDADGREKNGMLAAKYVTEYCMDNNVSCPKWFIQSSNTNGIENIDGLLKNFVKNFNISNHTTIQKYFEDFHKDYLYFNNKSSE